MADPFSTAYETLWTRLLAHAGFSALVRTGNRLRHDGTNWQAQKTSTQSADLPEIDIFPAGLEEWGQRSSDRVLVKQRLVVAVSTGDLRIDERLYPITYNLLAALENAAELGGTVVGGGLLCDDLGVDMSREDSQLNRGTQQWTAIARIGILHAITKSDLPT